MSQHHYSYSTRSAQSPPPSVVPVRSPVFAEQSQSQPQSHAHHVHPAHAQPQPRPSQSMGVRRPHGSPPPDASQHTHQRSSPTPSYVPRQMPRYGLESPRAQQPPPQRGSIPEGPAALPEEEYDPAKDPRNWVARPSLSPQPGSPAWREMELKRSQELFGQESEAMSASVGLEEGVQALLHGDWFYKWSQGADVQHRRWFWLDRKRWQLYWAKTNQLDHFLSDWIRLQEVLAIETNNVDHNVLGQRGVGKFYIIVLKTLERTVLLGTARADKFRIWYETLSRLTSRYRKARTERILAKHMTPLL